MDLLLEAQRTTGRINYRLRVDGSAWETLGVALAKCRPRCRHDIKVLCGIQGKDRSQLLNIESPSIVISSSLWVGRGIAGHTEGSRDYNALQMGKWSRIRERYTRYGKPVAPDVEKLSRSYRDSDRLWGSGLLATQCLESLHNAQVYVKFTSFSFMSAYAVLGEIWRVYSHQTSSPYSGPSTTVA